MPLDINLFRAEKGGNPDKVRETLRKRFKEEKQVDEIVNLDNEWRKLAFERDEMNKRANDIAKQVGLGKKEGKDTTALQEEVKSLKEQMKAHEDKITAAEADLKTRVNRIGNLVHESVPFSRDEKDNRIEKTFGECRAKTDDLLNHHELLWMIDGYDPDAGVVVAGHRGYFLKGYGVLLNQALINYGLAFLMKHKYTPLQPPFFMRKEVMAETAQLEEFDEALYKVSGADEEFYLIATSEQPISAFHRKQWLTDNDLPKHYAGVSSCFRKEAGAHGKDTWGIFRIHQFEKIEQFVVCKPSDSWQKQEEMIAIAEEFYKSLGFAYRVVNIVSGELNNAAARKFDLEAWFPTLGVYRELVSCSNCTDYQARAMETRYGHPGPGQREKEYVHMLNATLTATERTICCLLENYQTDKGIRVPEVLVPFMGGVDFLPFVKEKPVNINAQKVAKAAEKKAAAGK